MYSDSDEDAIMKQKVMHGCLDIVSGTESRYYDEVLWNMLNCNKNSPFTQVNMTTFVNVSFFSILTSLRTKWTI